MRDYKRYLDYREKELILRNKYQDIYLTKNKILVFRWLPSTDKMRENEYFDELKKAAKIIKEIKPELVLLLAKEMFFVVPLTKYDKVNDILLPAYNSSGVKKLAVVVSKDMIATLSIQQVIFEKKHVHNFETRYFGTEEEALQWLLDSY